MCLAAIVAQIKALPQPAFDKTLKHYQICIRDWMSQAVVSAGKQSAVGKGGAASSNWAFTTAPFVWGRLGIRQWKSLALYQPSLSCWVQFQCVPRRKISLEVLWGGGWRIFHAELCPINDGVFLFHLLITIWYCVVFHSYLLVQPELCKFLLLQRFQILHSRHVLTDKRNQGIQGGV